MVSATVIFETCFHRGCSSASFMCTNPTASQARSSRLASRSTRTLTRSGYGRPSTIATGTPFHYCVRSLVPLPSWWRAFGLLLLVVASLSRTAHSVRSAARVMTTRRSTDDGNSGRVLVGQDLTIQPESSGRDVVLACIALVQDSRIFPDDNRLLRRVAWVETADGSDPRTYRSGYHGGVWQVEEELFQKTRDSNADPSLREVHQKLLRYFGVDWATLTWNELRRPLLSAIAARMVFGIQFDLLGESIPPPGKIEEQGIFWRKYHTAGPPSKSVQDFVRLVNQLEGEGKGISLQLAWVIEF